MMDSNKMSLANLKMEIPLLETTKEGRLSGGFVQLEETVKTVYDNSVCNSSCQKGCEIDKSKNKKENDSISKNKGCKSGKNDSNLNCNSVCNSGCHSKDKLKLIDNDFVIL